MGNMIESLLDHAEFRAAAREIFLPEGANVCYFYHRGSRYNVTIAYEQKANGPVVYGAAFCRPEDQFCKKRGREIAIGRLHTYDNVIAHPSGARWEVHCQILNELTRRDIVSYAPENFKI